MASRARLRSKSDYEYAILWENVRTEYFSNIGDQQRADQCNKFKQELEWRLAMHPSTDQSDQSSGDPLVGDGWVPSEETTQFQ